MRRTSAPCALALLGLLLAGCTHTIVTGSAEYVPDDALTTTRPLLRITPPAADRPVLTVQVVQQGEGPLYRREATTRQTYWWSLAATPSTPSRFSTTAVVTVSHC